MASPIYDLFEKALAGRKQIRCSYKGHRREICPVMLGHTDGEEVVLTYQFAGESESGLPPDGQWKCLHLSRVSDVELRDGPWRSGARHTRQQHCVRVVDLDVNPKSPYKPKRRLPGRKSGEKPKT